MYMDETNKPNSSSLATPIAIVIGFGLIAAAIYFSGMPGSSGPAGVNIPGTDDVTVANEPNPANINPVTEDDHIRGNPNAQIMLVEYSDYDCPFCKNFHETMNQIMDEYGADGRVAWVYRQFPLEQLHPNAPAIAAASECVAELGGNDAFWTFSDLVFEERETNAPTNPANLPIFAEAAGVDPADYEACVASGRTQAAVEEDFANALAIGGRGTPHTIVMVGDQQGVINGAQPYEVVSGIIENLLQQLDGGVVSEDAS